MNLPEPEDDFERQLIADVERVGWYCVRVADEEHPQSIVNIGFSYTVGLTPSFGAPEVIVVGVEWEAAYIWLSNVVADLQDGKKLAAGVEFEEDGTKLAEVSDPARSQFMVYADWLTHGKGFEALQLLVPDIEGNVPGEGYRGPPQPLLADV